MRSLITDWLGLTLIVFGIIVGITLMPHQIYAQSNDDIQISEQTILSGNLKNDPFAQDILEKINQTRQWIAELEQREYAQLKAQNELEEKRSQALVNLEEDLKEWNELWEEFTFEYRFKKLSVGNQTGIRGVYWDQQDFTNSKIIAGKDALKKVIANGGTLIEAWEAYHKAAEIKRIEMIEINSQSNVNHGLAYYRQQLLFNTTGHFMPEGYAQEELNKYYTDYRISPAYLLANPDDKYARDVTETSADTQCRKGYVIVHRTQSNDYSCITEHTAEMWERHGIGKIVEEKKKGVDENSLTPKVETNPATKCRQGYVVVYYTPTKEYNCVLKSTAKVMTENGTGQLHSLVQFIEHKQEMNELEQQIYDVNQQIIQINTEYDIKVIETSFSYDQKYREISDRTKIEESRIINLYDSGKFLTKEEMTKKFLNMRENMDSKKQEILDEKDQKLEELKKKYDSKISYLKLNYRGDDSPLKITYNSNLLHYEAVRS